MATIVFGSIGTLVGGPIGGAIGSLIGRQVDSALFGGSNRQVGRLKELDATTSSYGQVLGRHFGRMRVAGSIIWATDLVEHSETQGGGKGTTSVTTYSYTASIAVALSSRAIQGVGRIWADGRLIRGAAEDLKVGGTLRIHTGEGDQPADSLLIAAEGADRCPAHRGLAYVVFEDLDLSDFYNRIPSLTFEVIADDQFDLQSLLGEVLDDIDAAVPLDGLTGLSCEGGLADLLDLIDQVIPIEVHASGGDLVITPERRQLAAIALAEPALPADDDSFGAQGGFSRRREPPPSQPPTVLRYYDNDRDFQPGLQRAIARPGAGVPSTLELPAAMDAGQARRLIEQVARRGDWSRDRIAWRTSELDPAVTPGTIVTLPDIPGQWRVREWEWRSGGVELSLERIVPSGTAGAASSSADPGRSNSAADEPLAPSALQAFELPPLPGTQADANRTFAAVSSPSAAWAGAGLYADRGDGSLVSLGSSGRARSAIGTAETALAPVNPLLPDRTSQLVVQLIASDLQLSDATLRQLAFGANIARVGEELVQFAKATSLGAGRWRLSGLLRGCGGTDAAVFDHHAGEPFALLDSRLVAVDSETLGTDPGRSVVALGRGDTAPVVASVDLDGISRRPLAPVHPRSETLADGTLRLGWTRRARGAWQWLDGVDVPLGEETERYLVTFGDESIPLRLWSTTQPSLELSPATVGELASIGAGQSLRVRQQGTYAQSNALVLATF